MKKTILLFTVISIFAKLIAFGRELVLSYYYGAGQISDVFLLSMTLPVTIFGFIAAGVTSGYIPVYQKARTEIGEDGARDYTNKVLSFLLLLCLGVVAVYFLLSEPLLRLFAAGFDAETMALARRFTDISIWAIMATAVVTVLTGYLQINDSIRITALVSVPLNLGVIVTIVLSRLTGKVFLLPVGFLLSSLAQTAVVWAISRKRGFSFALRLDRKDPYLRQFFSGLVLLVISGSLQQINILIDRTLATTVVVGGLSLYEYGSRISDFIMGLTIIPISTAVFPMMAKARDDAQTLGKTVNEGIRLSSLIIIPITVVTILYSDVIVELIYSRGEFGAAEARWTGEIVRYYGVGLLAFSFRDMILKCFYALGNMKAPVINASIGVACNIVLNFILLRLMGLGGLALATSVSAVISVVLLYSSLKKSVRGIAVSKVMLRSVLLFVLSGACGWGSLLIFRLLGSLTPFRLLSFGAAMLVFLCLYALAAFAAGIVSISEIKAVVKKRSAKEE